MRQKPLIVANWKMNGLLLESMQYIKKFKTLLSCNLVNCEIVICPPFTLLRDFAEKLSGTDIELGGQNCHHRDHGAHTGDVSIAMLKDMKCGYVIVGHSERRMHYSEGSELVRKKAKAAYENGIKAIICIGETLYEKENNLTREILAEQLAHSVSKFATCENTVIAYEPVWAIGSGKTPTLGEINDIHLYIKDTLTKTLKKCTDGNIKVIYGGSVTTNNASEILAAKNVDGLLVGKASLDADKFWQIVSSS